MSPFRKTAEGLLVTTGGVRFVSSAIALLVSLAIGAIGAARFIVHIGDMPTRTEFTQHVERDSLLHAAQARHDAFQDSVMAEISRKTQGTICFVYKNPKPFCDDQPRRIFP